VAAAPAPEAGPPFYTPADMQALRQRHGLEADPAERRAQAEVPLLGRDPTCGFVVELNATSAYALRVRQGSVNEPTTSRAGTPPACNTTCGLASRRWSRRAASSVTRG
jgi:hypothetical protein